MSKRRRMPSVRRQALEAFARMALDAGATVTPGNAEASGALDAARATLTIRTDTGEITFPVRIEYHVAGKREGGR